MFVLCTERDQGPLKTLMLFIHPIVRSAGRASILSGVHLVAVPGTSLQTSLGLLIQEEFLFTFNASEQVRFKFGTFVVLFTVFPN
jgi:hypothetical protein